MESRALYETASPDSGLDAPELEGELDISTAELMDEIAARYASRAPDWPPGSFTVKQFQQRHGFGRQKSRTILSAEVEAGRLLTKLAPRSSSGGQCRIYYPPPIEKGQC